MSNIIIPSEDELAMLLQDTYDYKEMERQAKANYDINKSILLQKLSELGIDTVTVPGYSAKVSVCIRPTVDINSMREHYPVIVSGYTSDIQVVRLTIKKLLQ